MSGFEFALVDRYSACVGDEEQLSQCFLAQLSQRAQPATWKLWASGKKGKIYASRKVLIACSNQTAARSSTAANTSGTTAPPPPPPPPHRLDCLLTRKLISGTWVVGDEHARIDTKPVIFMDTAPHSCQLPKHLRDNAAWRQAWTDVPAAYTDCVWGRQKFAAIDKTTLIAPNQSSGDLM